MIDHSLLKPDVTLGDLQAFAGVCREYAFRCACVNSCHTATMAELLEGSGVLVAPTVGFPLGAAATTAKAAEAHHARESGAGEVDMVINIGLLKSGQVDAVREDIQAVVDAVQGLPVKVILENCYLTDEEKVLGCRLAIQAGARFVKTSTGFGSGGATVEDVALMHREVSGAGLQVKAAGGIRDLDAALAMVGAGASRLGVSAGDQLADEFARRYPDGWQAPTG